MFENSREESLGNKRDARINTGVYLSVQRHERLQVMARADDRSMSNFISQLIDQAWDRYLAEKEASPLSQSEPHCEVV